MLTDIYWPSRGGVEESIRSLSSLLLDQYEIRIITHAKSTDKSSLIHKTFLLPSFKEYFDEAGIRVIPLTPNISQRFSMLPFLIWYFPFLRRIGAKKLFDYLYRFYRQAFKEKLSSLIDKADIIHSFSTSHLAVLSSELCALKNITLIHAPYIHFGRWGDSPLQLRAYSDSITLICPTRIFKEKIEKQVADISARIVINPPLPSLPPEKLIAPEGLELREPFILFLARREEHKGLATLLKAFKRIETSFYLVIAGPGKKIASPPPGCFDLGEVNENTKHWLLSQCTIFCLPSTNESFGMVYIEAMAYNKPIVALDIPPVNEIIIHNETGILVTPGDIIALTDTLLQLLQNSNIRQKLGESAGKRYREHYSHKHILSIIKNEYKLLLTNTG